MELVLDANILFSALIKEGITRELMLADEIVLFTPEYIINEFLEHIGEIAKKPMSKNMLLLTFSKYCLKNQTLT
jgi:predicted nucleic acid-binding protein